MDDEVLLKRCQEKGDQAKSVYKNGRISGCIFTSDEKHWQVVNKAMEYNSAANPLFFNDFHFALQCESEVVRMVLTMYNGDEKSCGILTGGGTDSIFIATMSYREYAKAKKGITKGNVVASVTGHCALDKACHYLGLELRKVPLIPGSNKCDVAGLRRCIDSNTLFIYASCPDFGHGNFDPMREISALALRYNVGIHADCCLGGFINPFIERAGYKVDEPFDFTLPGITTISCDTHKFGYAPKGSSVLMFRHREQRNASIFAQTTWNGGLYTTIGSQGSRNGAIVIGAWAAMRRLGMKGYADKAKKILDAVQKLRKAIAALPDMEVISTSVSMTVAVTCKKYNAVAMGEYLHEKYGWSLCKLQNPAGFHFVVTDTSYMFWEQFYENVKETIKAFEADPKLNHNETAAIYGYASKIPDSSFMKRFLKIAMEEIEDTHTEQTKK